MRKPKPKGNSAVAYVRVSTGRQVDEGNSIDNQIQRIRDYAKMRGLDLLTRNIVIESGVSGGIPLFERPAGKLLLARIKTRKFQHIISLKIDRMFRITSDAIHTFEELEEIYGLKVHIVDLGGQAIDTSNAMGKFFLTIMSAMAEMERGLISERTLEGMAHLKKEQLRFTRAIYGWDYNKVGDLFPNWTEQSWIDYMAWQVLHNEVTATSVARSLNKKGIKGKLGGIWRSQGVLRTINNAFHRERNKFDIPKWWGEKVWHRKKKVKKNKKVKKSKKPKVWTKDDLVLKR
jgi:DNA invertase Pin-like site-specific DNA recombinase